MSTGETFRLTCFAIAAAFALASVVHDQGALSKTYTLLGGKLIDTLTIFCRLDFCKCCFLAKQMFL